jgi:hypothetical protein
MTRCSWNITPSKPKKWPRAIGRAEASMTISRWGFNFGTNSISYHVIPIGVIQGYMLSLNPPGK